METTRRGVLAGFLAGLSSFLCLDKGEAAVVETDHFFDTIRGLPAVPVDRWFNHLKAHRWQDPRLAEQLYYDLWRDQIPIFYPEEAMQAAIAKMPKKLPTHNLYVYHKGLTELQLAEYRRTVVPEFIATNFRIVPRHDGRWLVMDIMCAKDNLPIELQHLTRFRTSEMLGWLTAHYLEKPYQPLPWPQYWGVSGMSCDLWPVATGHCEVTKDGVLVKEMEIDNFLALAVGERSLPTGLSWVWWGDRRGKLTDWQGVQKARYFPQDPYNPLYQVPAEVRTQWCDDTPFYAL